MRPVLYFAAWSFCAAQAPVQVVTLEGHTAHVQGIDTDGERLWLTSVDRAARKGFLQEYSVSNGRLLRSIEVQDGDRYHPGGIAADGDSLWIPVAEYRAQSTAVIQRRSKKTLALESQFSVPDHIGCIAVGRDMLIGGNWDSREFYVWNLRGELLRKVSSDTMNAYQDMKVKGGQLIAGGTLADRKGAVDWLDLQSFRLVRRANVAATGEGAPYTREGMTLFENQIWFLPEDGNSRLFRFDLSQLPSRP